MKTLLPFFFSLLAFPVFGQLEVPFLTGRVVDEANVLSDEEINSIEIMLKNYEDSTSTQIAILTVPSLNGAILEEYSIEVVDTWKLGTAENDNGVLLLVAIDDRKLRIEVGDGLEGELTDALCSRIIRNEIAPYFRQKQYGDGITSGIQAIMQGASGSYTNDVGGRANTESLEIAEDIPWPMRIVIGLVFFIVVGLFSFFAFMSKGCASWFLFVFLIPFYATFPIFILGFTPAMVLLILYILAFLAFKIFVNTSGGKKWFKNKASKWAPSGSGGWSSSSGGWSSGSSSSSFSGGGGSFSGGGSSGSW